MKYATYTLIAAALAFVIIWCFNHVNPWESILMAIGIILLLINHIGKKLKNQK